MDYERIAVRQEGGILRVTLNRPDRDNAIDGAALAELHAALDEAERSENCRMLVCDSTGPVFSAGMDLAAAGGGEPPDQAGNERAGREFFRLMKRFTEADLLVVAVVDGRVSGGGVGLVAASDLAFATPRSEFSLPEALWGLLPCCVLPFLIRRTGFQPAYAMTLSTQPVTAAQAQLVRLVDEVAQAPEQLVRRLLYRGAKLPDGVIGAGKRYCRPFGLIGDETGDYAVGELGRLLVRPEVRDRISGFVRSARLPWEGAP
jgi:polyketide biosynthesis enoyl-CoA hydratase PksH